MKIRIIETGKEIELTDAVKWGVREDGVLWNFNTGREEGVEGDVVEYTKTGVKYSGHVEGYTCYQLIHTKEWGGVVLSAREYDAKFYHKFKVVQVI